MSAFLLKRLLLLLPAFIGITPIAAVAAMGEPPSPLAPPPGCAFASRCPHAQVRCREERPQLRDIDGREVACHLA